MGYPSCVTGGCTFISYVPNPVTKLCSKYWRGDWVRQDLEDGKLWLFYSGSARTNHLGKKKQIEIVWGGDCFSRNAMVAVEVAKNHRSALWSKYFTHWVISAAMRSIWGKCLSGQKQALFLQRPGLCSQLRTAYNSSSRETVCLWLPRAPEPHIHTTTNTHLRIHNWKK